MFERCILWVGIVFTCSGYCILSSFLVGQSDSSVFSCLLPPSWCFFFPFFPTYLPSFISPASTFFSFFGQIINIGAKGGKGSSRQVEKATEGNTDSPLVVISLQWIRLSVCMHTHTHTHTHIHTRICDTLSRRKKKSKISICWISLYQTLLDWFIQFLK